MQYDFPNLTNSHDFHVFSQQIFALSQQIGVNLSGFEIDHLAMRANTEIVANSYLSQLLEQGEVLSDNVVNGRPIYLIELNEPLEFLGQKVFVIELPFPKANFNHSNGWEHVEIVMPFLEGEDEEKWQERILQTYTLAENSQLKIKISSPKAQGEQLSNFTIAISLADKSKNPVTLKIHPYSIKKVVTGI